MISINPQINIALALAILAQNLTLAFTQVNTV